MLTEESLLAHGNKTRCMEREPIHGLTAKDTKESIRMVKNTDTGCLVGLMVVGTMECGSMGFNMEKVFIQTEMESVTNTIGGKVKEGN
jgi:hypothetical protein